MLSRTNIAFRLAPPLHTVIGMTQRLGAFILVSLFGVGCGVGDDKVEPNDPNPENIVCTDSFKLAGTFTQQQLFDRELTELGRHFRATAENAFYPEFLERNFLA